MNWVERKRNLELTLVNSAPAEWDVLAKAIEQACLSFNTSYGESTGHTFSTSVADNRKAIVVVRDGGENWDAREFSLSGDNASIQLRVGQSPELEKVILVRPEVPDEVYFVDRQEHRMSVDETCEKLLKGLFFPHEN